MQYLNVKYIYKHGNQFWYQRAVPLKIQKIIGKTNIKVCLKTNKISTAVQRSKLQALEHKKMFHYVAKQNYLSKVFSKKTFNIIYPIYDNYYENNIDNHSQNQFNFNHKGN